MEYSIEQLNRPPGWPDAHSWDSLNDGRCPDRHLNSPSSIASVMPIKNSLPSKPSIFNQATNCNF